MQKHSQTISFRASDEMLQKIDEQRTPFGLSRGAWVRGMVQQRLEQPPGSERVEAFHGEMTGLAAEVAKLQKNLNRSLFIQLTLLGNLPAEQAKEIVRSKLSA
jgi:hypothetical protein